MAAGCERGRVAACHQAAQPWSIEFAIGVHSQAPPMLAE
jgi:hypothetical protein